MMTTRSRGPVIEITIWREKCVETHSTLGANPFQRVFAVPDYGFNRRRPALKATLPRCSKCLLAALLLASLLVAPCAHAENLGPGGGTRVIAGDELVGPYRILFTSSPEPAQIGKVTFLVRLSDPKTDEKVRDAEIIVELTHSETGATLSQAATHADAGNPTDYVAHVQVDQTGQWQGVLRVSGPPGTAQVSFMQRVVPKRQLSTLVLAGVPFLVILGLMAGLWYVRSGSQQKR
jgi:hypothetical protein